MGPHSAAAWRIVCFCFCMLRCVHAFLLLLKRLSCSRQTESVSCVCSYDADRLLAHTEPAVSPRTSSKASTDELAGICAMAHSTGQ